MGWQLELDPVIIQLMCMTPCISQLTDTKQAILNMFKKVGQVKINSVNVQTQQGGTDCGVFAIAMATSLGCGDNPAQLTFQQENLREHLLKCLES